MNSPGAAKFRSKLPKLKPLDPRLHAFRPDLADVRLGGKVDAEVFVDGVPGRVLKPIVNVKGVASIEANTEHQFLFGDEVFIFDETEGMSWVQSKLDGYVGYVESNNIERLGTKSAKTLATHMICVPMTFCYPNAELRAPPVRALSIGSRVNVNFLETSRGTQYARLEDVRLEDGGLEGGGWVIEKHLRKIDNHALDYVKVCELLLNIPYLWGGASGLGVDCSSLVQLSMRLCGSNVLRDSDMQAASLGKEIEPGNNLENLKRGDLIFWRGHVAVHKGNVHQIPHIIHASGHTMCVTIEPLHEAIERIGYLYEKPIGFRRPEGNIVSQ